MEEKHIKWHTKYLSRDFEMLVFGHAGYPVIVFPTSLGRYFQNKDFGLIDSAAPLVDAGLIKLYCPDSIDAESWYNKRIHPADRVKTHMAYENVIVNDVIELAKRECGTEKVALAGCSFGGYHAANTAFRHPGLVGYLISMSGAFNIKQFLDGYYDDNCYFNNPPDFLPGLNNEKYLSHMREMGIILNCGQQDGCLGDNMHVSNILKEKGIQHWLDVPPGSQHDWPWWREKFPHYLSQIHEAVQR